MNKLDLQFYRQFYKHYLNDDNYSDINLKKHWETYRNEDICFPNKETLINISKFDWIFYAENNMDIENASDEKSYIEHWINKGIYEGRIYTFDFSFYKQSYPDLNEIDLSNECLLLHWYLIGKNEGRICCKQELYKIEAIEYEIKQKNLDDLEKKRVLYDNLEIENGTIKNRIEMKFSELVSQFLGNELNKNEFKRDILNKYYTQFTFSLDDKNNALQEKKSLEQQKILDEKNKNLKTDIDNLDLELKKKKSELELEIISINRQKIKSLNQLILIDQKKLESEQVEYEESLIHKKNLLVEQDINKKKNMLIDLELKKNILFIEQEIIDSDLEKNSLKITKNSYTKSELLGIKNKIKKALEKKLEKDLFHNDTKILNMEERFDNIIKEITNIKISNKGKIFKEYIVDLANKKADEDKLKLIKSINERRLEINEEQLSIIQSKLKIQEGFLKNFNNYKIEYDKTIKKKKDIYVKLQKQKEIIYMEYEKNLIENDNLLLEIRKKENKKKIFESHDLEIKITELELSRKKKKSEIEETILREQEFRNNTLEKEIEELELNIKKNELLVKDQELKLKEQINDIEIKKRKYESECESLKVSIVEQKKNEINKYLENTFDYRIKAQEKRDRLKTLLISDIDKENLIEKNNLSLIYQKRKTLEEELKKQSLEFESIQKKRDIEYANQQQNIKNVLSKRMLSEIDEIKEKENFDCAFTKTIKKMEDFLQGNINKFDELYAQKIYDFNNSLKTSTISLEKYAKDYLNKLFVDNCSYSELIKEHFKLLTRDSQKELIEIENMIEEKKIELIEKKKTSRNKQISDGELQNRILEGEKKNFMLTLENLKKESESLYTLELNHKIKTSQLGYENEIKSIELSLLTKEEKITSFLNNIETEFKKKMSSIDIECENKYDNAVLLLTIDNLYQKYIKSRINFLDIIGKNSEIKLVIEDLHKVVNEKKSCNEEYEEKNRLLNEYNKLFRVNKKKVENKINLILNNISTHEKLESKIIIEKRNFNKFSLIKSCLENMYHEYPYLFHKHILGISQHQISYEVIKYSKNRKKYIAHLHCYNISHFEKIYGKYINIIKKYFYIIITFSYGKTDPLLNQDLSILKIKNKGMDIGGKIVCLHFLEVNEINYDIIFFMHSKTNIKKRNEYFSPFLRDEMSLSNTITTLKNNKNIGGIFPDCIHSHLKNDKEYRHLQKNNHKYLSELSKLLGIEKKNPIIFEGNVFMMKKEVLYPLINNLELIYSLLNDELSFDYNWFKIYNKLGNNVNLLETYNYFINSNSNLNVGNNISLMLRTHPSSFPDGMIEHAVERVWDGLLFKSQKKYIVI